MRVLVCGGRDFKDKEFAFDILDLVGATVIIQGGANGADYLACRWAQESGIPQLEFQARWNEHGRAAGPLRNAQMLSEGRPDLVVAFRGGRGTADMIGKARAAGVRVMQPS